MMNARCPAFNRPVVALLGLPVDAMSQVEALAGLELVRSGKTKCFLSTPNLNFAIQSQSDAAFRDSVCRSDLSVADGMPLVWFARWMGLPVRERVSGSSLFEALQKTVGTPWRVFLLGGPKGIAQRASLALGRPGISMEVAGWIDPGQMDATSMERTDLVSCINDAKPDFLVVALGAQKGQAWISRHLPNLQVPVISHLGAVVNFVAGTVSRAPNWIQRSGLEWLWRIKEEPHLWRRYRDDALSLLRVITLQVLPLVLFGLWQRNFRTTQASAHCQVSCVIHSGSFRLTLKGGAAADRWESVRKVFFDAWNSGLDVEVDAKALLHLDAHLVALFLLLDTGLRDTGRRLSLTGLSGLHKRVLYWHAAGHLTS